MLNNQNRFFILWAMGCLILSMSIISLPASLHAEPAETVEDELTEEGGQCPLATGLEEMGISYRGFIEGQGDYFLFDAQAKTQDAYLAKDDVDYSGRLRLRVDYAPSDESTFVFSTDSKYWDRSVTHDFYEIYWDHTFNYMDLRLGRQIVTWGRCDEIIPLDVVNPQDLRRFFLPLREERKLPVWMAHSNLYLGDAVTFSALWVPFFEANKIADHDPRWDIRPAQPDSITIQGVTIPLEGGVNTSIKEPDDDSDDSLRNGQFGFKLTTQTDKSIFDLVYYYGWDQMGSLDKRISFSQNGVVLNIRKKHFRDSMAGVSFSTLLGDFVLRGEAAYHWEKYFDIIDIDDEDALAPKDFLDSCLGLEYRRGDQWYINFLVQYKKIMDFDSTLVQRKSETILFGIIDKFWARKTFQIRLLYYYNLDDGDSRFNPQLSYELADGLRATLGAEIITGEADTDWGQFEDNDLIYLKFKYSF